MFFFAMTLSLCLNTVVCFIGSLGLPFVKAFTLVTTGPRDVGISRLPLQDRVQPQAPSEHDEHRRVACFSAPVMNSNGGHYVIYSIVFAMGRPVPTVLFPLTICGGYQLLTIANKHFPATLKRVAATGYSPSHSRKCTR